MFSFLPTLLIYVCDNLVSDGQGSSPTMNFGTDIRIREQFLLTGGLGGDNGASVLGGAMGADSGGDALTRRHHGNNQ
jgi:hypothetical protein